MRSDTHATDSTCSGWNAKIAATAALRPREPVAKPSTAKTSTLFAASLLTLDAQPLHAQPFVPAAGPFYIKGLTGFVSPVFGDLDGAGRAAHVEAGDGVHLARPVAEADQDAA